MSAAEVMASKAARLWHSNAAQINKSNWFERCWVHMTYAGSCQHSDCQHSHGSDGSLLCTCDGTGTHLPNVEYTLVVKLALKGHEQPTEAKQQVF